MPNDVAPSRPRHHSRHIDGRLHIWYVEDLWAMSKTLEVYEVDPRLIIDLDRDAWFQMGSPTPRSIIAHMRRILDADATCPVILHPDGSIMDGAHRTMQAILFDRPLIRVVRFTDAPAPSTIID